MTADQRLLSLIQRVENLETEKAAIAADIKEVFAEAKSAGFDVKTMKAVIRLRKMEEAERQEQEAMLDTYKAALGMIVDLPLGRSAMDRAGVSAEPYDAETGEIAEPSENPETIENAKIILRGKGARPDGRLSGCTSYIQRNLGIGYNAASRIMERLTAQGFIGEADADGCRTITAAPPDPIAASLSALKRDLAGVST